MTTPPLLTTLPSEIIESILANLTGQDLLNCMLVHPTLLTILRSPPFYKRFYGNNTNGITFNKLHTHIQNETDAWAVHYTQITRGVVGKNLLKHVGNSEGDLSHWTIHSGSDRTPSESRGWSILPISLLPGNVFENMDVAMETGPLSRVAYFFCTDEYSCSKSQLVDLWGCGFTPAVMRACIPFRIGWGVDISTPPTNSGGYYDIRLRLLDQNSQEISIPEQDSCFLSQSHSLGAGEGFRRVGGEIRVEGGGGVGWKVGLGGVRWVCFYHGGMGRVRITGSGFGDRGCGWNWGKNKFII